MKEEIVGLIRDEIEEYKKVTAEFSAKFNKINSSKFYNDATRDSMMPMLENRYIEQFEDTILKQSYLDIIDVCDDIFEHIKELCNKNQIPTDIESKYNNIKEISHKEINDKKDYYDINTITMPVIKILHKEYVKFLDYQRLVKFQQQSILTEEECISIAYYLMSKNLIYFYLNIDKYPVNTLLVKKIMNTFSKKHGIRPEDTLEVFQEYIGNGEESKRIMEHETPMFWGDIFL